MEEESLEDTNAERTRVPVLKMKLAGRAALSWS